MRHTLQPLTLTITMESPAEALLVWATLGVATSDVRKLVTTLKKEGSQRLLRQAIDAPIEDTTYPIWNALDEELRKVGLV